MKKLLGIFALALALPVMAFAQSLSATLAGANEVPGPGDTDGVGFAVVSISGTTINYSILVQNLGTPTQAHIHTGGAGTAGAVLLNFNPTFVGGTATGSVTATQDVINKILGNPAGFLRQRSHQRVSRSAASSRRRSARAGRAAISRSSARRRARTTRTSSPTCAS